LVEDADYIFYADFFLWGVSLVGEFCFPGRGFGDWLEIGRLIGDGDAGRVSRDEGCGTGVEGRVCYRNREDTIFPYGFLEFFIDV